MSERKLQLVLPVAILVVAFAVTMVMIKSRAPVPTRPPREYTKLVRVMTVHSGKHKILVSTQGTVKPRTESELVSEVSGRVIDTAPSFAVGGFFKKEDVLVKIDPRDYELAVVNARAQVAQAKLRLKTEEAQALVARKEWEVLGDGNDSPLATRELQLEEARAARASAEAALEQAKRNLDRTSIKAPFTGRLRDKLAGIGQFVSPGVPLAKIYAVDYVEVRLPITDSDLAYLDLPIDFNVASTKKPGPVVHLYANFARNQHHWTGRIVRVEGEIDPLTRMLNVVAQIDEPYGKGSDVSRTPLAVGLFVEAKIEGIEVENAFTIPRSAVRSDGTVLVVDSDNRLHFRRVNVFRVGRKNAIVTEGLEDGERVCLSLLEAVSEGMKVRTVKEKGDSLSAGADISRSDK